MYNSIHGLKLHEEMAVEPNRLNISLREGILRILRVPGGWIYYYGVESAIFVPYSDEFRISK